MPASLRDFDLAGGENLGLDADRVALEEGRGELHVRHAEIADGRADRRVVDGNADHQAEREQEFISGFAPLVSVAQKCASICRAAGSASCWKNSMLSICVTVRVRPCRNTFPGVKSSK